LVGDIYDEQEYRTGEREFALGKSREATGVVEDFERDIESIETTDVSDSGKTRYWHEEPSVITGIAEPFSGDPKLANKDLYRWPERFEFGTAEYLEELKSKFTILYQRLHFENRKKYHLLRIEDYVTYIAPPILRNCLSDSFVGWCRKSADPRRVPGLEAEYRDIGEIERGDEENDREQPEVESVSAPENVGSGNTRSVDIPVDEKRTSGGIASERGLGLRTGGPSRKKGVNESGTRKQISKVIAYLGRITLGARNRNRQHAVRSARYPAWSDYCAYRINEITAEFEEEVKAPKRDRAGVRQFEVEHFEWIRKFISRIRFFRRGQRSAVDLPSSPGIKPQSGRDGSRK
jgi:hypothetical protein